MLVFDVVHGTCLRTLSKNGETKLVKFGYFMFVVKFGYFVFIRIVFCFLVCDLTLLLL